MLNLAHLVGAEGRVWHWKAGPRDCRGRPRVCRGSRCYPDVGAVLPLPASTAAARSVVTDRADASPVRSKILRAGEPESSGITTVNGTCRCSALRAAASTTPRIEE